MTQTDEHDALSVSLKRLIETFRAEPDQTIVGWETLVRKAGMSGDGHLAHTIRQARRIPGGQGGQLVVKPHGRKATEFMWTTNDEEIARQQLRHQRISYAYGLHVYWSEHQQWDRLVATGAPQNRQFEMNYEMRKSQETIAAMEAKIVSIARTLGLSDKKIASFFRVQVTPNDPVTVHALAV